jgi:ABC-type sugar transport system substrate-binding protein
MEEHMSSKRRFLGVAGAVALAAAAVVGPAAQAQDPIKVGVVIHVIGDPFIQQIADAAKQAGDDLGIEVQVVGPEGFDGEAQMSLVQSLVDSGVDGIATSVTGESMVSGLNDIIADGLPVVQFNILRPEVNAPYVGERSTQSGRTLGALVLEEMGGADITTKAIIGNCAPGFLPVLDNRAAGMAEALSEAAGVEILGPFDVKVAANENYAAWESLLTANPDATGLIGACAPDVTSLGQLQAANQDLSFVSGGYDLTSGNLAAIKEGNAFVSLGQTPFMQGYLPVKILYDAITGAKDYDLTQGGFIDAGTEIVTAESVTEPYDLPALTFEELEVIAADPAASREYYQPLVDGVIANWPDFIEPVENESL